MRNKFMDWFGLAAPILQAPIGGMATVELAAAVGSAGGMGSLALTWHQLAPARTALNAIKAHGAPFFINFVLCQPNPDARSIIEEGVPAVTLSWGLDADLIKHIQGTGARVGVQVGSATGAKLAISAGADFIIAQGVEAGGHVQSTTPLQTLLRDILNLAADTPVLAAGGISTGADLANVLANGAAAAMLGTRFVATTECIAHPRYKQAIIAATPADTAFTNCFDGEWPYAMHRILRNPTFDRWEAAGCPASPHRPGEGDVVFTCQGSNHLRYSCIEPARDAVGSIDDACLYAGCGVGAITAVEPAATLVSRLWSEAQALL